MKALSLWEPWASAMAFGLKQNETRSWPTKYRGDLVICAAKRPMDTEGLLLFHDRVKPLIDPKCTRLVPYGCALAVVELWACEPSEVFTKGSRLLTEMDEALGNYTPGRFVWMTRNLRQLREPFLQKGRQGLFDIPDALITAALTSENTEVSDR